MDPDKAGAVLLQMPVDQAAGMLGSMSAEKAAKGEALLYWGATATFTCYIHVLHYVCSTSDGCVAVLGGMPPDKAAGVVGAMNPADAATVPAMQVKNKEQCMLKRP